MLKNKGLNRSNRNKNGVFRTVSPLWAGAYLGAGILSDNGDQHRHP